MADCSKTVDFFKEFNRMCDTFDCDDNCPFLCFNSGKYETCEDFVKKFTDEAVQILQKWSDSHPAPKPKTYADDFFEKHPNAPKRANGMPMAFRCQVYGCSCGKHEANMINGCEMCWNEPYKEEEE